MTGRRPKSSHTRGPTAHSSRLSLRPRCAAPRALFPHTECISGGTFAAHCAVSPWRVGWDGAPTSVTIRAGESAPLGEAPPSSAPQSSHVAQASTGHSWDCTLQSAAMQSAVSSAIHVRCSDRSIYSIHHRTSFLAIINSSSRRPTRPAGLNYRTLILHRCAYRRVLAGAGRLQRTGPRRLTRAGFGRALTGV